MVCDKSISLAHRLILRRLSTTHRANQNLVPSIGEKIRKDQIESDPLKSGKNNFKHRPINIDLNLLLNPRLTPNTETLWYDKQFSKNEEKLSFRRLLLKSGLPEEMPRVYNAVHMETSVQKAWYTLQQAYKLDQVVSQNSSSNQNCSTNDQRSPKAKDTEINNADSNYTICLPPINVTGNLHLGHALTCAIQDTLVRYERMRGKNVTWTPGFDHAGIATEVKVEQHLRTNRDGKSDTDRRTLGRQRFIECIEAWSTEKMDQISHQFHRMGLHMDWPLEKHEIRHISDKTLSNKNNETLFEHACTNPYTLDSSFKTLVADAFCLLNQQGLIYRSNRLVNWSYHLKTAISDLEVKRLRLDGPTYLNVPWYRNDTASGTSSAQRPVKFGQIWEITYPLCDLNTFAHQFSPFPLHLLVQTTRPETIAKDVALAVHPADPKYSHLVNSINSGHFKVLNPLSETPGYWENFRLSKKGNATQRLLNRYSNYAPVYLPIILDERVDPNKGTGCLKLTPAHDTLDYEIYKDHVSEINQLFLTCNSHLPLKLCETILSNISSQTLFNETGLCPALHGDKCINRHEARDEILGFLNCGSFERSFKPYRKSLNIPYFKNYYDYPGHTIALCGRSGELIEFVGKPQWYLKCQGKLSQDLLALIHNDPSALTIYPETSKLYGISNLVEWLHDIKDWCLSRQIWWGHPIPAYTFADELTNAKFHELLLLGHMTHTPEWVVSEGTVRIIARNLGEAQTTVNMALSYLKSPGSANSLNLKLIPDQDVFDTWFSSALYPIALRARGAKFGGQIEEINLQKNLMYRFYGSANDQFPNLSLLETGFDIQYLWVARMLMLGLNLTGRLPFQKILYHGIVNDAQGRKMSKSLGNVIDPLDVINGATLKRLNEKLRADLTLTPEQRESALEGQKAMFPSGIPQCGADALRIALLHNDPKTQVVKVNVEHMDEYRRFGNKVWQGVRYVFHARELTRQKLSRDITEQFATTSATIVNFEDLWILSRLSHLVDVCNGVFAEEQPISKSSSKFLPPELDDNVPSNESTLIPGKYDFQCAVQALKRFWVQEFCDIYLEITKGALSQALTALNASDSSKNIDFVSSTLTTLSSCQATFIKQLHPYMPHLTEALWFYVHQSYDDNAYETPQTAQICSQTYPLGLLPYPNAKNIVEKNHEWSIKDLRNPLYENVMEILNSLSSEIRSFVQIDRPTSRHKSSRPTITLNINFSACFVHTHLNNLDDCNNQIIKIMKSLTRIDDVRICYDSHWPKDSKNVNNKLITEKAPMYHLKDICHYNINFG